MSVSATPVAEVPSRPRVLHIIARILAGSGGDENTIFTVNGLSRLGYDCMVVYGGQSEASHVALLDGVEGTLIKPLVREIDPWKDLCALAELKSLMRRYKPDIVHTHTAKAGVLGRLAARLSGVPVVVHGLHGTTFHPAMSRFEYRFTVALERFMGRFTTAFMSVSNDLSELYMDHHVGRPEQYVTVRSGMKLDNFLAVREWDDAKVIAKREALGLPPDRPLGVMVARLEQRKRIDRFLKAIAQLVQSGSDAVFALAGDGPERQSLEQMTADLGISDRVYFLGFRDDVPEVVAAASVVCLTSAWEGLPRVLVQTVAVGRMIVCYDVNGAREVVSEGVNGHVVTPDDIDTFCARLQEQLTVLPRPVLCATIDGDPIERWQAEAMVRETAEAYECLLEHGALTPDFHQQMLSRYHGRVPALTHAR